MSPELLIGVIVVVVLVVLFFPRGKRQENLLEPQYMNWNAANDPELLEHIAQGRAINAIKWYRELTGQGLKEAKDVIDYMIAQGGGGQRASSSPTGTRSVPQPRPTANRTSDAGIRELVKAGQITEAEETYAKFAGVDVYAAREAVAAIRREVEQGGSSLDSQIRDWLAQNRKIEAIKLYRQATGLGLKEAKDVVDAIEREMHSGGR